MQRRVLCRSLARLRAFTWVTVVFAYNIWLRCSRERALWSFVPVREIPVYLSYRYTARGIPVYRYGRRSYRYKHSYGRTSSTWSPLRRVNWPSFLQIGNRHSSTSFVRWLWIDCKRYLSFRRASARNICHQNRKNAFSKRQAQMYLEKWCYFAISTAAPVRFWTFHCKCSLLKPNFLKCTFENQRSESFWPIEI